MKRKVHRAARTVQDVPPQPTETLEGDAVPDNREDAESQEEADRHPRLNDRAS
jgi:hypothetical protein